MKTLKVMRGLQGSGKSTLARQFIAEQSEPLAWKYINKDSLRLMFDAGVFSKANEKLVHDSFMKLVSMALTAGFNVVADNTHPDAASVRPYHQLAEKMGDIDVVEEWVRTPIDECRRRNALRTGVARVPDEVITTLARRIGLTNGKGTFVGYNNCRDTEMYYSPLEALTPLVQDETLPPAIICDLDGTLALLNGRNPYDASHCDETDTPCGAVVACIQAMSNTGHRIIFMSGRDNKDRAATLRFIDKHLQWTTVQFELHMRAAGDQRKDTIVKRELFDAHVRDRFNVKFVIDDRDAVVALWREMGLVCMQVRPGAF